MAASIKFVAFLASLMILVYAAQSESGTASYYTQSGPPPVCYESPPTTTLYAAASPAIWGTTGACGKRYRVTCTGSSNPSNPNPCIAGASVEVQIIDFCLSCQTTFDLSRDAFAAIADLNAGTISIQYNQL